MTPLTDEDILKLVDKMYKPRVSAHLYTPQDYPAWLIEFARIVETETARRMTENK